MALYQFLCGLTVVIILSSKGCHSQPPKCGHAPRNSRIVGGQDASPGSWPWQVLMNHSDYGFFCGGSLITDQWVMTSADCMYNQNNITVHLGRYSQSGPNSNEVSRGVDQVICHPSYYYGTYNNICLLKLTAPVNFTDYIFPICLASENSTFHNGTDSWVTGWGYNRNYTMPNILQEVKVPIMGNNECKCIHQNYYYYYLTENTICTGPRGGGKGPCYGDEGGPLVTKKDSSWVQIGIVYYGYGCGYSEYPSIYTRVSQYQEWINNVTDSSQLGFVTYISSGIDSDVNFICPKGGDSVFDSGENLVHFSHSTHLISLCVLVLSLCGLVGDA